MLDVISVVYDQLIIPDGHRHLWLNIIMAPGSATTAETS